jgi:uncharacterized protein (TIGR03067 family)
MTAAFLLMALAVAQPTKDDGANAELKRLDGTWVVESIRYWGEKQPADKLRGETLTVKDGKYEVTRLVSLMGFSKGGSLVVDRRQTQAILARCVNTSTPGAGPLARSNGIYRLEDDTLTVCFSVGTGSAQQGTWTNAVLICKRPKT